MLDLEAIYVKVLSELDDEVDCSKEIQRDQYRLKVYQTLTMV